MEYGLDPALSSIWPQGVKAARTLGGFTWCSRGPWAPAPPDLLRAIIRRVQDLTGTTLHEQDWDAELSTNQWRPELDPGAPQTGHIELLLQDEQQAVYFQDKLANVSVEVQQRTIPLLVTGDSLVAGTFRRT